MAVGADLVVPLVILDCSVLCMLGGKRRALPPVDGERGLLLVGGELGGELGSTHRRHITWTWTGRGRCAANRRRKCGRGSGKLVW